MVGELEVHGAGERQASRGRVGVWLDLPGAVVVTAECYAATNAGVALSNSASDATPNNRRPDPTLTPDRALRRRVNPLLSVRTWRRS